MNSATPQTHSSGQLWTGRILTILATAFLVFDGGTKVLLLPFVVQASAPFGYTPSFLRPLGIVLLLSTALYAIPRTAVFGALLLTAYLGGAVEACIRIGVPAFNVAFPIIFAVLIWASLLLRYPKLRTMLPLLDTSAD